MHHFKFQTDEESYEFCVNIAKRMTELFSIPFEQAVEKINDRWAGQDALGSTCLIYHETEEYWAKDIYYGPSSNWWQQED